jgi:NADH:ubiquinone oxidoreductase subunit H
LQTSFTNFVSGFLVARLIPVAAAWFVLKAALDTAQGHSPLGSIVAAIFLLSVTSTIQLFQGWNSGSQYATTDMLVSAWNFLAGHILPEAAGLAIVAAIINYVRHKPVGPLVTSALAFLSISAVWKLVQTMVQG